jgi:hypothetical protein
LGKKRIDSDANIHINAACEIATLHGSIETQLEATLAESMVGCECCEQITRQSKATVGFSAVTIFAKLAQNLGSRGR